MTDKRDNTLLGLGLFFGIGLLAWFFADLLDSRAGERTAAFGAIIGGLIGAGAAVFAVNWTISRQRSEDTAKVRAAIRTEVTTYSKYVIRALEVCEKIKSGAQIIPLSQAVLVGSINIVVVMLAGRLLFGERLDGLRIAGMSLIAAGVALAGGAA